MNKSGLGYNVEKGHILIINRYFYPDISSVPQLLTELAEDLTAAGYRVSVICSRNSYNGARRYPRYENHKGIHIYRVNNIYARNKGILYRVLEALTFFILVFSRGLRNAKVDMVLTLSSPPLSAFIGLQIARLKRAKSIYLIEDLHPNLAAALGYVKPGGIMYKAAWKLNQNVLKKSGKIVVLGKYMRNTLVNAFKPDPGKIVEIPNWADEKRIFPLALRGKENPLVKEWELEKVFTVQYSGNMGLGHNFETILKGIDQLKTEKDIRFVFIGDGPRKKEITAAVNQQGLNNLDLYPYQPYEKLSLSLNACDISLVSIRPEVEGLLVPSKIYGILAAGKPFILVGGENNEIAEISKRYNIGRIVKEGDVEGFVNAVFFYKNNPDFTRSESESARTVFENHFTRSDCTSKYIQTIKNMLTGDQS
jgi:glycosyltransferase involved in cell wall biosynthesis